jgi:hypothetical protein
LELRLKAELRHEKRAADEQEGKEEEKVKDLQPNESGKGVPGEGGNAA